MTRQEELEKRVEQLERELAVLRGGAAARGVRKRADWGIGNLPFWEIAVGPDLTRGEMRGHAKAVFAVGDVATGVVAVGGLARGVVALGGLALGILGFGGLSIGVLAAVGGLAIGSFAFGGGALGGVAIGGGAVGHYACGGGAAGDYVVTASRRDPEAVEFFRSHGLDDVCLTDRPRRIRPPMPEEPVAGPR